MDRTPPTCRTGKAHRQRGTVSTEAIVLMVVMGIGGIWMWRVLAARLAQSAAETRQHVLAGEELPVNSEEERATAAAPAESPAAATGESAPSQSAAPASPRSAVPWYAGFWG